jgi:hypothetical protein
MKNNKLQNPILIRLTLHQEKALSKLEKCGINKSKFIRQAVQEKLERDFSAIMNKIERSRVVLPF